MPDPNPGLVKSYGSLAHLRTALATGDPMRLAALAPLAPFDYGLVAEECGQALDTNKWTTAVTAGGAPTAFVLNTTSGSWFSGATGTTDDGATAIHAAATFLNPTDNPWFIIRWKIDVVTGFSFEIGMSDPKTGENLPGVTDVDTPAIGNGVTDIGCIHLDTDQTLTTAALVGDGTTGSAVKTDIGTYTPTAGAWQHMVIGVRPNLVTATIYNDGAFVGQFSTTNGPDANVLVRPYALFRTRNTTTKIVDIDYMAYGWERNQ